MILLIPGRILSERSTQGPKLEFEPEDPDRQRSEGTGTKKPGTFPGTGGNREYKF